MPLIHTSAPQYVMRYRESEKKLTVDKTDRQIEMDEKQGGEKGKREGKKDSSIADKTINPHGASNHHPH